MRNNVSKSGCEALVHQRETDVTFLPTCSESHLAVLFFSTREVGSDYQRLAYIINDY